MEEAEEELDENGWDPHFEAVNEKFKKQEVGNLFAIEEHERPLLKDLHRTRRAVKANFRSMMSKVLRKVPEDQRKDFVKPLKASVKGALKIHDTAQDAFLQVVFNWKLPMKYKRNESMKVMQKEHPDGDANS